MKQGVLITLASALLACGSDTTIFADPAGSTGSGGANAGGSGSGASGTGGAGASTGGGGAGEGGAGECVPGSTMRCYGGPDGTAGVGICTAGVATCNRDGTGYGRCEGEVLPATEDCNAAADEDCDGLAPPCSTGTHLWSKAFGGADTQSVTSAGVDAASNIIFGGELHSGIDFGGGHTLSGTPVPDIFLVKLTSGGAFVWAQALTGSQSTRMLDAIAVNGAGDVVAAGMFQNTLNIGSASLSSVNGSSDAYVARLDPSGQHLWSQSYGDGANQRARRVAFAPNGDIVVAGTFTGTIAFSGLPFLTTSDSVIDAFVVRLTGSGTPLWAHHISGPGYQDVTGLAVDTSGAIVVGGVFDNAIDLGGGGMISAGNNDVFVAKLSASGAYVFGDTFGNSSPQRTDGVAVDGSGNVILAVNTVGAVDFGGGAIGSGSVVVVKLDGTGNHVASAAFGSAISYGQTRVAADAFDNIVLLGEYFEGSVDFGGGALPTFGNYDVFLAKLSPSLGHLWSHGFGSSGSESAPALALDPAGYVAAGGHFQSTMTIGPNTFSPDGFDAFAAWYAP